MDNVLTSDDALDAGVELKQYKELNDSLEALEAVCADIQRDMGISQGHVVALESISPGMLTDNYPPGGYTIQPSQKNLKVALEEIETYKKYLIGGLIAVVAGLIVKLISWLFSTFTNSADAAGKSSKKAEVAASTVSEALPLIQNIDDAAAHVTSGAEQNKRAAFVTQLNVAALNLNISENTDPKQAVKDYIAAVDRDFLEKASNAFTKEMAHFVRGTVGGNAHKVVLEFSAELPVRIRMFDDAFKHLEEVGKGEKYVPFNFPMVVKKSIGHLGVSVINRSGSSEAYSMVQAIDVQMPFDNAFNDQMNEMESNTGAYAPSKDLRWLRDFFTHLSEADKGLQFDKRMLDELEKIKSRFMKTQEEAYKSRNPKGLGYNLAEGQPAGNARAINEDYAAARSELHSQISLTALMARYVKMYSDDLTRSKTIMYDVYRRYLKAKSHLGKALTHYLEGDEAKAIKADVEKLDAVIKASKE